MKNQTSLRNNKMNTTLRSILASSLIALTMMSCSKETIEPASVNSLENARTRSNQTLNNNDDQAMIDIRLTSTNSQAETRITISNQAILRIASNGQKANEFSQYKLSTDQLNALQSLIATANSDQAYSASDKQAFIANQAEGYSASSKQAFTANQSEAYTASSKIAFDNNQAEAYSASSRIAFNHNQSAEGYNASNNLAFTNTQVELRSCSTCNPNTFSSNGNAQERTHTNNFMNEVARIINLQALLANTSSN